MSKQPQISPEKYIITKAATLPFHECFISEGWIENGMASILLSKKMPSGKFIVGSYLIDMYCLGLKDTLFKFGFDQISYSEFLDVFNSGQKMIDCNLTFAHNLIYGAIDFAHDLGFSPQKDFKITEHLLDPDLIDDGIDEIEFGKDGKPLYVAGPYDNINRILSTLDKNAGAGKYHYILPGN